MSHFANFVVLILDLVALVIYIDLYIVMKYQKHIYTWAFEYKLIA